MLRRLYCSAMLTVMMVAGAQAAYLVNVQGAVLLNQGYGFQPAKNNTAVTPGDRIQVVSGSASIDYGDGCAVSLAAGQTVAVAALPLGCNVSLKDGIEAPAGVSGETLLIGGLAIGGGIAILLSNNNGPASP